MIKKNSEIFNYESKPFGVLVPSLAPHYFQSLKIRYCLESLTGVSGRVLEVGCGGGGMAKAIGKYRPDMEIIGSDISRRSLRIARKKPLGVKFIYADVNFLPFADNYFSAVVMFDFLEHFEKHEKVLKEIFRVVKPGGIIHSATPIEGGIMTVHGLLRQFGWKAKEKYCGHLSFFSHNDLEKLMTRAGFKILSHRWSGHLLYQLIDAFYFSLLEIRGKNTPFQVEGYLEFAKPGIKKSLVFYLKNFLATTTYFESILFKLLPGGFLHLTVEKK